MLNEKFRISLQSFLWLIAVIKESDELCCKDEKGVDVDWFLVYKLPRLEHSSSKVLKSGFGYAYITDTTVNHQTWILSDKLINQNDSILGQTIGSVLDKNMPENHTSVVVYNDQPPNYETGSTYAHAKGIFAVNDETGFWIVHSVPNFPLLKPYQFPGTASVNGQTVLCMSISADNHRTLDNIAIQLLLMKPDIYHILIRNNLIKLAPHWNDLQHEKWIEKFNSSHLVIQSRAGVQFDTFSKSEKFNSDLYSALIAPQFKANLLVQSWRNGAGDPLDSDCADKYKVQNVHKMKLFSDKNHWDFKEDHSKWSITSDNNQTEKYICIADINRMRSQFRRGGGSVCLMSGEVWSVFNDMVESIEGCRITGGIHSPNHNQSQASQSNSKKSEVLNMLWFNMINFVSTYFLFQLFYFASIL